MTLHEPLWNSCGAASGGTATRDGVTAKARRDPIAGKMPQWR
jgi:hypothetical protein